MCVCVCAVQMGYLTEFSYTSLSEENSKRCTTGYTTVFYTHSYIYRRVSYNKAFVYRYNGVYLYSVYIQLHTPINGKSCRTVFVFFHTKNAKK